jgi:hypothetical protein
MILGVVSKARTKGRRDISSQIGIMNWATYVKLIFQ